MIKKYVFLFLLFTSLVKTQNKLDQIWDLIAQNKRNEAFNLVQKELQKNKDDYQLNLSKLIVEQEQGKVKFTKNDLSILLKDELEYYIYPLNLCSFASVDKNSGYNDSYFEKTEELYNYPKVKDTPLILMKKHDDLVYTKKYKEAKEIAQKFNNINKWQLCGVFDNPNHNGIFIEYEPEKYAKNDKLFDAENNGSVNWYIPKNINSAKFTFENELIHSDGIVYLQTFINSEIEQKVLFDFTTQGFYLIFLNDVEILMNDKYKSSLISSNVLAFNLQKGVNRLLVKLEINNENSYFLSKLTSTEGNPITNVVLSNAFQEYKKNNLEFIKPNLIKPKFEFYFENKVKENPLSLFHKYMLINTYLYEGKFEDAELIVDAILEKYPKSSFFKLLKITSLAFKNDASSEIEELKENIKNDDPDYYYSLAMIFYDQEKLKNYNNDEILNFKKNADKLKSKFYPKLFDFYIASRQGNKTDMLKFSEEIISESDNNHYLKSIYSTFYKSLENDTNKTLSILEDMNAKYGNKTVLNLLINEYKNRNEKEKIIKIHEDFVANFPEINTYKIDLADYYHYEKKYDKSIELLNQATDNFPYSSQIYEELAKNYSELKLVKEAEINYNKAISHNTTNFSLRKKRDNLLNKKSTIDVVATQNLYDFIKKNRGKEKMKSEAGVQVLLDEYIIEAYPEGGTRGKAVLIYEIISESGIEKMKEYAINNYSAEIIKSEVVKQDGTITPADASGSNFVFENLKVNDVIYIEYYTNQNDYGRFHKDFSSGFYFNGEYPVKLSKFGILTPKDKNFKIHYVNKNFKENIKNINGLKYTFWEVQNIEELPEYEVFSPSYDDNIDYIKVTSIKDWSEIHNWYSGLVKSSAEFTPYLQKVYDEIFPKGIQGINEYQRGKMIYNYMSEHINYSSVDFRQGSHIPQKPEKTLKTKLGDCKDLSILFLTLAKKAGIHSNLVLVLTNDEGTKNFEIPSRDFNHCIIKTSLDGKDYFLELTNKYAPFNYFANHLLYSKALIINDNNLNDASLTTINNLNSQKTELTSKSKIKIENNQYVISQNIIIKGNYASYNEMLFNNYSKDKIKNDILEVLNSNVNKNIEVINVFDEKIDKDKDEISFQVDYKINEKLQKVSGINLIELPYIFKAYTQRLIALENRKFEIFYPSYESIKTYSNSFEIQIDDNNKFIDLPENKKFEYKNHKYSINYKLIKPNVLKVDSVAETSFENISKEEYAEFKKFIENVLETENVFMGFK